ncbi:glucose-1-phosphate cytidylyltransferase [Leptolyngbya sp. FACHB-261]|uniref:glucose-1-phosphate cytidylyltransferase n=1 Tax=Leptolyngbya sp. FACHB-261 TaxID=2692806 RepID=UPI001688E2D2|nr:glucose-1-phosphate cytidylyltransferase [Leptolyngbya sp. FACHB-261]MBD2102625.1 glucose-1-phosphate cytidylyltransferase [Leptolyngbya sp. FACHB-261]
MKVAILAGGLGTRLSEETEVKPKPMVEVGGQPILWHIMRHYAHYGLKDFAVALGYKGEVIKKYMADYCSLNSNLTIKLQTGEIKTHGGYRPDWQIELVDTGIQSMTGGRIRRLAPHLGNETFMLTYGDGVSDVNLQELLAFHRSHGKLATLTVVHPPTRFGYLEVRGSGQVMEFSEKPQTREGWINGGFFVLEPEVFNYIDGDETTWEKEPLERLAEDGQLMAYQHTSFWQCMDTLRDKRALEALWQSNKAPWKIWEDEQNATIGNRTPGLHRHSNGTYAVGSRI